MTNSEFWDLLNAKWQRRRGSYTLEQIRHYATLDRSTGEVPTWVKNWLKYEDDSILEQLCHAAPPVRVGRTASDARWDVLAPRGGNAMPSAVFYCQRRR